MLSCFYSINKLTHTHEQYSTRKFVYIFVISVKNLEEEEEEEKKLVVVLFVVLRLVIPHVSFCHTNY